MFDDEFVVVDGREQRAVGAADDGPDAGRDRAGGVRAGLAQARLVAVGGVPDERRRLAATLGHQGVRPHGDDQARAGLTVEAQPFAELAPRQGLGVEQHRVARAREVHAGRARGRQVRRRDGRRAVALDRAEEARVGPVVVEVVHVVPRPDPAVDDLEAARGLSEEVPPVGLHGGRGPDRSELDDALVEQVEVGDRARPVDRGEAESGLGEFFGAGDGTVALAGGVGGRLRAGVDVVRRSPRGAGGQR
ncbi:hypothetical protein, partial [Frigoribacterium sp. RIT-PI-h]|uniref:hypothetical protein n=1 Tax=Frigoribacterium sp. RIT-PI-h TaxID=1690245 RepID=UPI0006B99B2C